MNTTKLSFQLLKNNMKMYLFYLGVISVTIAIYYEFLALQYNSDVDMLSDCYQVAKVASIMCSMILFWVVVFFMWHSNHFFVKQRQKEIGLYMLMGITPSKIGKVFAMESILLGVLAFIIGLPVGLLFTKLFFMLLAKAMILDTAIPFAIPIKAVIHLVIVFSIIFLILGLRNYTDVRKSKLIELIYASKKEAAIPKLRYTSGVIGVILIALGYGIAIVVDIKSVYLLLISIGILLLICIGTFLFFKSFLAIVIKKLLDQKNIIYKHTRLLSFSNILFRLGLNYKNLAMTAILSASAVTAFGFSLSMRYYAEFNTWSEVPYSLNYISSDPKLQDEMIKRIQASPHQLINVNTTGFLLVNSAGEVLPVKDSSYKQLVGLIQQNEDGYLVTSYSNIKQEFESINYPQKDKTLKRIGDMKPNEIISVWAPEVMGSFLDVVGTDVIIENEVYRIKADFKLPFIGGMRGLESTPAYILEDSAYAKLKEGQEEIFNQGINFTDPAHSEELVRQIMDELMEGNYTFSAYVAMYQYKYQLIGSMYFLGIIMSIVFILATFSTLYFKVLSDALSDKAQYEMLKKIGMTRGEVLKSIYTQVAIAFVLPVLLGAVHAAFAIHVIGKAVDMTFYTQYIVAMGVFIVLMIGYYILISKKYFEMVYEKNK